MITPPYLKKGDKVGVVAPARWVKAEEIEEALKIIESWGLEIVKGENLYKQYHQFAGTDEQRAADLQGMLDSESIRAIICARGGYGVVRIVDMLNFGGFCLNPKWLVGFSDITVLHSHIQQNFGIETIHASMPFGYVDGDSTNASLETLRMALFGESIEYELTPGQYSRKGFAQAKITGGNLSLLCNIIGSVSDCDTDGKILFLEDVDEYLYHIDRMMQQLKRSGKLRNLAGLIVGNMSDMHDNVIPFGMNVREIIANAVAEYDYPVLFDFPSGHEALNKALILGRTVILESGENKAKLSFLHNLSRGLKNVVPRRFFITTGLIFILFIAIYFIYYLVFKLLL